MIDSDACELQSAAWDGKGIIAPAIRLGYLTSSEFDELMDCNSKTQFMNNRQALAALVLLAEGEELW